MELTKQDFSLTVVIPTLNSAATLDWTLASLCPAGNVRVIVADSFSDDGTHEICSRWNVEKISVPAGNMYRAINAGLRLARTDWIAYVNSDDWVFTASYLKMLETAEKSTADVIYGSADYVDKSGRFLFSTRPSGEKSAVAILRSGRLPFCQPATIFRRTVYESLNGFDEQYRAASDLDFFCRAALMECAFARFGQQPVAAFRLHGSQISSKMPDLGEREQAVIKERLQLRGSNRAKWAFLLWQLSNIPRYAERMIRTYELSGKLTLERSSTPPKYE